jgi:hypothetical protein
MEIIRACETFVPMYQIISCHNPEFWSPWETQNYNWLSLSWRGDANKRLASQKRADFLGKPKGNSAQKDPPNPKSSTTLQLLACFVYKLCQNETRLIFIYIQYNFGERRGAYRVLVTKPEGKRPRGRPRRRWEDTIKMNLQELEWGQRLDWSGSS